MKVLVTGCQGQLAQSLKERAALNPALQFHFAARPELDLSRPGSADSVIAAHRPELVINAAAYTAVDRAESEPELAFRCNADAAGEVASAAKAAGAPVIQLSTDYVFAGTADAPYREDAPTAPINVYGRSKLAGEDQVRLANPNCLIVRTSWLYSPFGSNFVKTMLRLAEERNEVRVVADQIGCPTSALDIADALLAACEATSWGTVYHIAGRGACTWAEFASEIFATSAKIGGPCAEVVPIATSDFPTPAARPRYSALDSSRFEQDFGLVMPDWRESVALVVRRLVCGQ